jgi:hypothetical protein
VNGRNSDRIWESEIEYITHGLQTNRSEYVAYVRSDLASRHSSRLPPELVERIEDFVMPSAERGTEVWTPLDDLLRDILEEVKKSTP